MKERFHKFGADRRCMYCRRTTSEIFEEGGLGEDCGADQRREMVQTEETLQKQCEEWLIKNGWVRSGSAVAESRQNIKGIFVHIPNQAFGSVRAKSRVGAYLKNLPDLILFHPDGRYLTFELKSRSGKSNKGQRAIAKHLNTVEEKIFDNFVKRVVSWYYLEDIKEG